MRALFGLSALVFLSACGAAGVANSGDTVADGAHATGRETSSTSTFEMVDIESGALPNDWDDRRAAAPWSAEPVATSDVPGALVRAWASAENREWCAPLTLGTAGRGVPVRRADYHGGWAVEFDKRGMPGVDRSGQACTDCGRGAYGIAGTAVMVDQEDPLEAEERTLADGSRVRIETSVDEADLEEGAEGSVATLKIRGQECVYQVWSFSGDAHLQELLEDLRFVGSDDGE
ncbi:MAG: hypothetical protein JRH11_08095 [Deltaproteobacteria bacterium]|nr:hypothetical protein [Deltaproteobacteria bacterium]